LLRLLDEARPEVGAKASLDEIEEALPDLSRDLEAGLARASDALAKSASPAELEDIRRELLGIAAPLADWEDQLEGEAQHVAEILDRVEHGKRIWMATRDRAEAAAAGDIVMRRIETSIEALEKAATRLRAWQTRVLDISDRVINRSAASDAAQERLQTATVSEHANLLVPNRPPLWARGLGKQIQSELPLVPQELLAYARGTLQYVERDARPLIVHALLTGLLIFGLARFSSRARERLAGEEVASRAIRMLECPYAIGLLLALLASPIFHPLAPRRFMQLLALIALFPAARIVVHTSQRANPAAFVGLFALLLLRRFGLVLQSLPGLERVNFLISLALGLGLALWFWRRVRVDETAPWLRRLGILAILGLALALLAETTGWTDLGTMLGLGILGGAIAAVYVYAASIALAALLGYALVSRTLRRSYVIARSTVVLQRRIERALRWLAVGLWIYLVLVTLGLRTAAADVLASLLDVSASIGALSLSIGGVLAFVVTLLVAFFLARIVMLVLEEDVYPRTHLPRGVPYALSTLVRYGIYSLGFLFALAAAGVELGQVSIMVGGLGIGIGLGLQDLVKNFAAGLTLLLERRVHVGDVLEIPSQTILGDVLSIGMRASVIRTWTGAEVVVPNADLISSAVTNWTLSDRLYRIEVPVGVAYGTDPARVIELLLEAVRSDDSLLTTPAPQALFIAFGDSSLDFLVRAWTDEGYGKAVPLTSQLALAVHRTLHEAGITIPFPQRDLHVVSVSPDAGAALSRAERPD
jgi:small-conductance mechanosensitive channel